MTDTTTSTALPLRQGTLASQLRMIAAALWIILASFAYLFPDRIITRPYGSFAVEVTSMRALFRLYVLLVSGFVVGWLLQPTALAWLARVRTGLSPRVRRAAALLSVLLTASLLSALLIHWGRHQFGAWDFGILIDTGWRQILGQRPYVDFPAPTPPFFNWAAALAFRLFGVTWNANLYLAAVFLSFTLVWAYVLLRDLRMSRPAALGTSALMQCAAVLSCSFLWYNNTTLILAALLFLSALRLAQTPPSHLAQTSWVFLIAILPFTKPNIAGVTVVGCFVLLLLCSPDRKRLLQLSLVGLLCSACLAWALHLSIPAMLATYRGIAKERGGASTFGFDALTIGERRVTVIWVVALCIPLLWGSLPRLKEAWQQQPRLRTAYWLFFPFSALVAIYGIAGNGEWRDVECTLLLAALALLAFVYRPNAPLLRRTVVALMCSMATADLYVGAARLRVFTVGLHRFFEWTDNEHRSGSGFLKDLRGSELLLETDREVGQAVRDTQGPYFLGPRIDFEYAALRLVSPTRFPTFFQPGTSFDRARTGEMVRSWQAHRFQTAIFYKDEYTFYPDDLTDDLLTHYTRDDSLPLLTLYRRRSGM